MQQNNSSAKKKILYHAVLSSIRQQVDSELKPRE